MVYKENKVKDINIAYIGGGSREWAWKLIIDLALEESLSGTVKLYDIQHHLAKENMMVGNKVTARDDAKGKWKYEVVDSLEKALKYADIVVLSILPGTFDEMHSDVHWPEKYGIYQTVGDSVGPGGFIRAMRSIPIYIDFANAIRNICPDAWIINYTNPMTICTRILYEVFPEIKAFGCCHEVFHLQKLLSEMLLDLHGITGVTRDEISINVLGINHCTWIDKATYKGMDLFPIFEKFIEKYKKTGFDKHLDKFWPDNPFGYKSLVVFDLYKKYGIMGAAGDRHLVEFFPEIYLKDPETLGSWKVSLTTVPYRVKQQNDHVAYRQRVIRGEEELEIIPSGEEGVRQIKALMGLGNFITNVNLPNHGQLKNIPGGAVVETNAYLTKDHIYPVVAGALPKEINDRLMIYINSQESLVKASMKKDLKMVFNAFKSDLMISTRDINARQLFIEMLENTKEYLKYWGIFNKID